VGNDYVVQAGLKPGDRIVASGVQKLGDGVPIMPLPAAPPGGPGVAGGSAAGGGAPGGESTSGGTGGAGGPKGAGTSSGSGAGNSGGAGSGAS
jgi:hypothetical protein